MEIKTLKIFRLQEIFLALGASFFLAIASQLSIPLEPVPFTFQTVSVFIISSLLGSRVGALSVFAYLVEGIAGLPVFANCSAGIQIILGPTGGYLLGFFPAAYFSGKYFEKSDNSLNILLGILIGLFIIFGLGYFQLANFIGFVHAYNLGVRSFMLTEIFKIGLILWMIRKLKTH